ncbi:amidase [Rhizobium sp. SG_E_25_P2]|uniref:amidase n=1 Tax=Rhizobium sp. SG_E_25_P2 TaxID=2879942 RepID=UPI002475AAE3|nr:amidase [Rhizobium sp. SG_E_25_P2]MDH6264852.1 amidase [Rhizobium sp. SG_E_25_P2]
MTMRIAEYQTYDALGLAQLVKTKAVSPVELLKTAISLIEALDPVLNTVVHRHFDLAFSAIEQGLPDGLFTGVPFLIKNTGFEVKDMILSTGSRLFADAVSSRDGTLAARYKNAGLVIVGKSNTPEFALSFATEPSAFGVTRNPWNTEHGPGGSSGGSAAAVAAGIMPMANASDGAGSTRLPASHSGLFGFKPSRMRNPLGPVAVEGIAGMSTPHALSWSVRDNAALLDASAGPDIGDPYAAPAAAGSFLAAAGRDPKPLRIGLTLTSPLGTAVHPDIIRTVEEAASFLESLGHHVELVDKAGYDAHALKAAWRVIAGVNVAPAVLARGRQLGLSDPISELEPVNAQWVREGLAHSSIEYLSAVNQLHQTARSLGRFFERYDVLMSPVTGELAPVIGEMASSQGDLDSFYDRFWSHGPFTCAFNASGCPAMSVPFGQSQFGLPIGVHLGAAFGGEELLFSLAGQIERARPWFHRRPRSVSA